MLWAVSCALWAMRCGLPYQGIFKVMNPLSPKGRGLACLPAGRGEGKRKRTPPSS